MKEQEKIAHVFVFGAALLVMAPVFGLIWLLHLSLFEAVSPEGGAYLVGGVVTLQSVLKRSLNSWTEFFQAACTAVLGGSIVLVICLFIESLGWSFWLELLAMMGAAMIGFVITHLCYWRFDIAEIQKQN